MKISRRNLLTSFLPAIFLAKDIFADSSPKPGDFKLYSNKIDTSGILKLTDMDVMLKPSEKMIYGDGHGHKVPLSKQAWSYLSQGKALLVRTGVDTDKKMHAHWIKVHS